MSLQILKEKCTALDIHPLFPSPSTHSTTLSEYLQRSKEILQQLLPEEFFLLSKPQQEQWLQKNIPYISWEIPRTIPESLTLRFLYSPKQEVKVEKALLEIIRKWLIPEKEVTILSFHNFYFYMREITSRLFFLSEVKILIEDGRELNLVREHLPLLTNEFSLCLSSSNYLEHILDTKALTFDQKSMQVQAYLRRLIEKIPAHFDVSLFKEMSTFYALSLIDFRKFRMPKHIARIIISHFLIKKKMLHLLSVSPDRRHLEFRFVHSTLYFPFGSKPVLGLSIGITLSDRYEVFEDMHILDAMQQYIPHLQIVKGSYYFYKISHDAIKCIYLELEKKDGSQFQKEEITFLTQELKEELKKRVERLIPSVFMIRNEEEVMKNLLLLSQELKYISDIPQVMISFDKQEGEELFFTILLVRVLKKHDLPIEKLFRLEQKEFRFQSDRVQNIGYIRKKIPKEANVFHVCIPKERSILRLNSSVNFYLARQKVISILTKALGDIRDYNGGMILKQGELFSQFKEAFSGIATKEQELIENFFFSLNPIEFQATVSIKSLKILFQICLEAIGQEFPKRDSVFQKILKKNQNCFAVLRTKDKALESILHEDLNSLENFSKSLIKTRLNYQGTIIQGFIYETENPTQQKHFQEVIETAVKKWKLKILSQQELRLSFINLPPSLDPRLGGDEYSSSVLRMLFEGLTHISEKSKPFLALAQSVDISSDQKRYIFTLRPSKWSDGTPLVAYDFEYAWKKILSPSFYTPFTYFFYPIQNAKLAKEGKIEIDQVGVKAVDALTLIVDLENPTPEFLEYIAHPLYSPINHKLEKLHPNWAQSEGEKYVCNGPMKLDKIKPNGGYVFVRNPHYWDYANVKLDKVFIFKNTSQIAREMYKNDEIDWFGYPMYMWEPTIKDTKCCTKPLGTHWCVFNTQKYPFHHVKIRQAFSYAIDRKTLSEKLPNAPTPAMTPLPLIHTSIFDETLIHGNKKLAICLFEEALKELNLTRKNFPIITLYFTGASGRNRAMVAEGLIAYWEEIFGISCRVEEYPFHILFSKMIRGEYLAGMMTWKAWVNDPFYSLSAFQYQTNLVNFPKWEHSEYQRLLEAAQKELIPENRNKYFKSAEQILIEESPVIPIHYEVGHYSYKKELQGVFCSDTGNVDFRKAYILSH